LSSKIEGTRATLQEVLVFEASPNVSNEKYNDIQEILNYRKAMAFAVDWLNDRHITLGMLKQTHQILLDGTRGENKMPGEFRNTQNWIGAPGSTIDQASFVPPSPLVLQGCLDNFEEYLSYDEKDKLVQMAIIHAQFEIIHPFNDGNGRLGRMLIPLFLFQTKQLVLPMFYISAFFERHRDQYIAMLKNITDNNDWEGWILFFLEAVSQQAKINTEKAKAIIDLYESKKQMISKLIHSQFVIHVVDTIFKMPIFNTADFIKTSGIPKASASRFIKILVNNNILQLVEKGQGRRPSVMVFSKLFDIIK
jgi:Fic family protein